MSQELTSKQLSFCHSYITNHDAKSSAISAGYSKSFAEKKSYQLLKNEKIKEKIEELQREFYKDKFAQLSYESMGVLEEIIKSDYLDEKVRLSAIKEVFKYYGLERKLSIDDSKSSTGVNIIFNEVSSRNE